MESEALLKEASSPETPHPRLWEILGVPPESDRISIRLIGHSSNKIAAIKELRAILNTSLREAKDLVEGAPCVVKENISLEEALLFLRSQSSSELTFALDGLCFSASSEVQEALAQNPNAPADLLRWLSFSKEPEVIRLLVQNPGLPVGMLWIFGAEYPEEALQNPIWPMLLLEDPTLSQIPQHLLHNMIQQSREIPAWMVAVALLSSSGRASLAMRAETLSPEVISSLLRYNERNIDASLAMHAKEESVLWALSRHTSVEVRKRLAFNRAVTASILQRLSWDEEREVREGVAKNPKAPPEALRRLLVDPESKVRRLAESHPNAPKEVIALLERAALVVHAEESDSKTHKEEDTPPLSQEEMAELLSLGGNAWWKLARYSKTPAEAIATIATGNLPLEDPGARVVAVHHPSLAPALLSLLYRAGSEETLRGLTYERQDLLLSQEELETLARCGSYAKRLVAMHPNASEAILSLCVGPYEPSLYEALLNNPRTPVGALWKIFSELSEPSGSKKVNELWLDMTRHPNTPPELLARLAEDPSLYETISQHPNTPEEVLTKMAQERPGEIWLLECIAKHPNASVELLRSLSGVVELRASLLENPKLPKEVLLHYGATFTTNELEVREGRLLIEHPNTPVSLLEALSHSESEEVRDRVARNPNCPRHVLQRLLTEKNLWGMVISNPGILEEHFARRISEKDPTLLEELAHFSFEQKMMLAVHSRDRLLLSAMSFEEDKIVQGWVAANEETPAEALERLYQAGCDAYSIASNANAPLPLLWEIARSLGDEDESVFRQIVTNPNVSQELILYCVEQNGEDSTVALCLPISPLAPFETSDPRVQEEITGRLYPERVYREWMLEGGKISEKIKDLVYEVDDFYKNLAGDPKTPLALLWWLYLRGGTGVRDAVCYNPNASEELRALRKFLF